MLSDPVLVDTGALLAMYNKRDQHHEACREQSLNLPLGKVFTCWPVITEAVYMLGEKAALREEMLDTVQSQDMQILALRSGDLQGIRDVFEKYHDQQVDLADACLVHLAERENIGSIFTTDRRHFSVFRKLNGEAFSLLPDAMM
ncbi:MAG: PIN domain-containing protein [Lacipirellulaceae bacterium]